VSFFTNIALVLSIKIFKELNLVPHQGIEGHINLAKWLVEKEKSMAISTFEYDLLQSSNHSPKLPEWLRNEIDSTLSSGIMKHKWKVEYFYDRWEAHAAIKKMAFAVINHFGLAQK